MSDIEKELRGSGDCGKGCEYLLCEAADEITRLRTRIEELDKAISDVHSTPVGCLLIGRDGDPPLFAVWLDGHVLAPDLTNGAIRVSLEQIDAAWVEVPQHEYDQGSLAPAEALAPLLKLGIVACEECGGSGEVLGWTDCEDWVNCPACHRNGKSHGWVWKEASDE